MKRLNPLLFGMVGGLISSALFYLAVWQIQASSKAEPVPTDSPATPTMLSSLRTSKFSELNKDFVTASEVSRNSVVYIKTIMESRRSMTWMDLFFGGGGTQQVLSSGSGVIWSKEGHVVTNNHVIGNAVEIEVLIRKKPYKASVIGRFPSADLAVLKINGENFPAAKLGSSRDLEVGEWVLAVGNPFNLTSTVTGGIVSAKGRDLGIVKDKFPLESFIQTDAAINPGNSGGALVNMRGELVGINTAILSRTGSYSGYGFAVPIDVVKKIVTDLIAFGKVQKAFLGAETADLDYDLAQQLEVDELEGVVLTYIQEKGPADQAGLKRGDIIRAIDGFGLESKATFEEELSCHSPGDKLRLLIERSGKEMEVEVMVVNEEGSTEILVKHSITSAKLGADFEEISQQEAQFYKLTHGVKLSNIKNGLIRQVGIEDGFILIRVNETKISTAEEAVEALTRARGRIILEGISKDGIAGYYSYYR